MIGSHFAFREIQPLPTLRSKSYDKLYILRVGDTILAQL
jgi:hypothetical protein